MVRGGKKECLCLCTAWLDGCTHPMLSTFLYSKLAHFRVRKSCEWSADSQGGRYLSLSPWGPSVPHRLSCVISVCTLVQYVQLQCCVIADFLLAKMMSTFQHLWRLQRLNNKQTNKKKQIQPLSLWSSACQLLLFFCWSFWKAFIKIECCSFQLISVVLYFLSSFLPFVWYRPPVFLHLPIPS